MNIILRSAYKYGNAILSRRQLRRNRRDPRGFCFSFVFLQSMSFASRASCLIVHLDSPCFVRPLISPQLRPQRSVALHSFALFCSPRLSGVWCGGLLVHCTTAIDGMLTALTNWRMATRSLHPFLRLCCLLPSLCLLLFLRVHVVRQGVSQGVLIVLSQGVSQGVLAQRTL